MMTTVTDATPTVTDDLDVIDGFLRIVSGRSLCPSSEVTNMLLEVRSIVARYQLQPEALLEERYAEVEHSA